VGAFITSSELSELVNVRNTTLPAGALVENGYKIDGPVRCIPGVSPSNCTDSYQITSPNGKVWAVPLSAVLSGGIQDPWTGAVIYKAPEKPSATDGSFSAIMGLISNIVTAGATVGVSVVQADMQRKMARDQLKAQQQTLSLPQLTQPTAIYDQVSAPVPTSGVSVGQVALIGLGMATIGAVVYLVTRRPTPQDYRYGPPQMR